MNDHPTNGVLADYVAGSLDEDAVAAVLTHLVECEDCLARVDELWTQSTAEIGLPSGVTPTMEESEEFERSLFNRIHRAVFMADAVRLSTQGSLAVLAVLLRPIAALGRPFSEKGKSKKW